MRMKKLYLNALWEISPVSQDKRALVPLRSWTLGWVGGGGILDTWSKIFKVSCSSTQLYSPESEISQSSTFRRELPEPISTRNLPPVLITDPVGDLQTGFSLSLHWACNTPLLPCSTWTMVHESLQCLSLVKLCFLTLNPQEDCFLVSWLAGCSV